MVDVLRESHRVLKPEGLLIDLRPAVLHRRVGCAGADGYRLLWVMRESFEDDRAADRAVAEVVSSGLFKKGRRSRFPCYRVMDTIGEFREWLADFASRGKCPSHDWLVRAIEDELEASDEKTAIVVSAPLTLQILRIGKDLRQ